MPTCGNLGVWILGKRRVFNILYTVYNNCEVAPKVNSNLSVFPQIYNRYCIYNRYIIF